MYSAVWPEHIDAPLYEAFAIKFAPSLAHIICDQVISDAPLAGRASPMVLPTSSMAGVKVCSVPIIASVRLTPPIALLVAVVLSVLVQISKNETHD